MKTPVCIEVKGRNVAISDCTAPQLRAAQHYLNKDSETYRAICAELRSPRLSRKGDAALVELFGESFVYGDAR